jgi:hypothetical protein
MSYEEVYELSKHPDPLVQEAFCDLGNEAYDLLRME